MTSLSYTVPVAGSTLNSTADPEIATALTAILAWAGGNIDGTNVAATLTGRRLVGQATAFLGAAAGSAANYYVNTDGTVGIAGTTATGKPFFWWYLDPANYAITGKSNTQFIMRTAIACGTGPSVSVAPQLNALTVGTGGSGTMTPGIGALQGSSGSTTPSGTSTTVIEGSAFSLSGAGAYVPILVLGGTTAANSSTAIVMQLYVVNS